MEQREQWKYIIMEAYLIGWPISCPKRMELLSSSVFGALRTFFSFGSSKSPQTKRWRINDRVLQMRQRRSSTSSSTGAEAEAEADDETETETVRSCGIHKRLLITRSLATVSHAVMTQKKLQVICICCWICYTPRDSASANPRIRESASAHLFFLPFFSIPSHCFPFLGLWWKRKVFARRDGKKRRANQQNGSYRHRPLLWTPPGHQPAPDAH